MTVDVKINPTQDQEQPQRRVQANIELNIRKSVDGNLMISDHDELDIVIMPTKNKIVAFPKDKTSDSIYAAQDRLFYDLSKKGLILPESVHAGNIYGSMEARLASSYDGSINPVDMAVLIIGKFIKEEEPFFALHKNQAQDRVEDLTDPSAEDSTELGEVPHVEKKGSLRPGYIRGPYGMTSFYRH